MLLSPGYFNQKSLIKEQNKTKIKPLKVKFPQLRTKQKSRGLLVYFKNMVFSPKIEIQKTLQTK